MPELLGVPTCSFCHGQLSDQTGAGWKWTGLVAAALHRALEGPCPVQNGGGPLATPPLEWGRKAASASKVTPPIGDNTGPKS